jgi:DNA-directed RNA polymerase specialized sigma24 family protein/ribosome-associated translation inhibitor RaiA
MNVHISYKVPKTADVEREFNHNIEKIGRRLQVFRPELVHLHAIIESNSAREGFVVSLNLRLPSGQMAAREAAAEAVNAIKAGFDDLLEELTKHKDRLRSQHKWVRRRRVGRTRPQPQVPFEETFAAVKPEEVTDADVSAYINANLPRLARYVERELRYRQNNRTLAVDALLPEEVVDEVVALALGNGHDKPQPVALEPWLYRLAMRAIEELAARSHDAVETVSLSDSARPRNVEASDEPVLQYHQPDETFMARDVIADPRLATPEAIASSDEMISQVEMALAGAERADRDAFILFAIEGFTPQEIAQISDRSVADVQRSINAAREHLRRGVGVGNELRDKLLQHSRIA